MAHTTVKVQARNIEASHIGFTPAASPWRTASEIPAPQPRMASVADVQVIERRAFIVGNPLKRMAPCCDEWYPDSVGTRPDLHKN